MLGARKSRGRHQRSRPSAAAARPMPPTSASEPGASSGGPITTLNSGSRNPPGLRATPRTWVTTPISPSSAVQRRERRQPRPRRALGAHAGDARGCQRRRERDRRPHPLVAERAPEVLEVDLQPERQRAERRRGGERALHPPAAHVAPPARRRGVVAAKRLRAVASSRLSSRPIPAGRGRGTARRRRGATHAVEQQLLDPDVVVEVLEVDELRERGAPGAGGSTVRSAATAAAPRARHSASTRSSSVIPAQRVTSACSTSTAPAASIALEVGQLVAVLAGGDRHPAGRPVAQQPQALEVVGGDRLLEPAHVRLAAEALGELERLLARVGAVRVDEQLGVRADRRARRADALGIARRIASRPSS